MITFKKAESAEDALMLARTRQRVWQATYRGIYPDEMIDGYCAEQRAREDLHLIEDPQQLCYLIKDGEECVGYYCFGAPVYGEYKDFTLCLNALYLLPPYQRQGYGSSIMSILRHYASIWDIPKFYCCCNAHNLPAQSFYRKMGGLVGQVSSGHENPAEDQIYYEFYLGAKK